MEIPLPPPALEQGLYPLHKLQDPLPLPEDVPYPLLQVFLSAALEQAGTGLALAALTEAPDRELRQALSLISRVEARQAASLAHLPASAQEMASQAVFRGFLSLEATAALAQRMGPGPVREALCFLLPEYLDELYRLSNALMLLSGAPARLLLQGYGEIMPGRPLIACHRHPFDGVRSPQADLPKEMALTALAAAEAAKGRFYLTAVSLKGMGEAEDLLEELALLSQDHETQLLSLLPRRGALARLYLLLATEKWLYDSWAQACPPEDPAIAFFQRERDHEEAALRRLREEAARLGTPLPELPALGPLWSLGPNKGFVRETLESVGQTLCRGRETPVGQLPRNADFFRYQKRVCPDPETEPGHRIAARMIALSGSDYRYEIAPHPVEALRNRTRDETRLGR